MLATPKPVGYERVSTDGALEIGLIGVAADLAIAACLFELLGKRGIVRTCGFFLTASEALSNFRAVLKSGIPKLRLFTEGNADGEQYLRRLEQATISFTALFSARAAAVHAGAGVSHDVAFIAGKSVADLLAVLAENPKWRPT
jgi:hypothetical protein